MPAIIEAIDKMSATDRVRTMEYLWAAMTNAAEIEAPAWHEAVLADRRRRAQSGEESFMSISESKRRLRETVNAH